MSVTKLRGTLQGYFEHMTGKVIEGVGIFDGEIIISLEDKSEVCLFTDENDNLCIQINERAEFDA